MVALVVTAANVVPGANAKYKYGTAGETITAGQPVYQATNGLFYKADANAAAPAYIPAGIAVNNAALNQPLTMVYEDDDFTPGGTLSVTAPACVYVLGAAAAGDINPVADLAVTWYPVVLFIAKSTSKAVMKIVQGAAAL